MNRLFIVTILCLCTTVLSAQNILRGKIIDKETKLPISGAYVSIKNIKQKTVSDKTGNYQRKYHERLFFGDIYERT